jgi:hypothetical protein
LSERQTGLAAAEADADAGFADRPPGAPQPCPLAQRQVLEFILVNASGKPVGSEPYRAVVEGAVRSEGLSDERGRIRLLDLFGRNCRLELPQIVGPPAPQLANAVVYLPGDPPEVALDAGRLTVVLPEKPWVELQLNDANGRPVSSEPYRVRSRSGAVFEGKLDAQGFARVKLDWGMEAEISFPALNDDEWDAPPSEAAAAAGNEEAKTDWVEIELLDLRGLPLGGQRYRVTPGDGEPIDGVLDEAGRARLDGLAPGEVEVTFPDLDGGDWSAAA